MSIWVYAFAAYTHKIHFVCVYISTVKIRWPRVPSLISATEQNAEYDWWRAACCEEWLCTENSQPWMIYTVCFPVIISCSITALHGFTRQKAGVIEEEEKHRQNGRGVHRGKWKSCIMIYVQATRCETHTELRLRGFCLWVFTKIFALSKIDILI